MKVPLNDPKRCHRRLVWHESGVESDRGEFRSGTVVSVNATFRGFAELEMDRERVGRAGNGS